MKNIALIDVDSHNFPNYALMKISTYHKNKGDNVFWYDMHSKIKPDKIYASKIFNFSKDIEFPKGIEIEKGGTGYDVTKKLPAKIDSCLPDYSIYPQYDFGVGFLTRGCRNKCSWCVVPEKEGLPAEYLDIETIVSNSPSKDIVLMDNNILASDFGIEQLVKIGKMDIRVDFSSGFEARLITPAIARILSKIKWYKPLRMACDTLAQMPSVKKAVELLRKHNVRPNEYFCYVLIKDDIQDALARIEFLRSLGVKPYAQPFRDLRQDTTPTREQKQLQRWCNQKKYFNSCKFSDFIGSDYYAPLHSPILFEQCKKELTELEKVIDEGLSVFWQVGMAISKIRAQKLWKLTGEESFEAYLSRRFGIGKSYASKIETGASTYKKLLTYQEENQKEWDLPQTNSVYYELATHGDTGKQAEIIDAVLISKKTLSVASIQEVALVIEAEKPEKPMELTSLKAAFGTLSKRAKILLKLSSEEFKELFPTDKRTEMYDLLKEIMMRLKI